MAEKTIREKAIAMSTYVHEASSETFWTTSILLVYVPTIILAILSYVMAGKYWDANCDGAMMRLPVWLLVFAIFETVFLVVFSVGACRRSSVSGTDTAVWASVFHQIFRFIWVIVGGVAIFRDAVDCYHLVFPLWAAVNAVFYIEIIIMIGACGLCGFCLAYECCAACFRMH